MSGLDVFMCILCVVVFMVMGFVAGMGYPEKKKYPTVFPDHNQPWSQFIQINVFSGLPDYYYSVIQKLVSENFSASAIIDKKSWGLKCLDEQIIGTFVSSVLYCNVECHETSTVPYNDKQSATTLEKRSYHFVFGNQITFTWEAVD